MRIQSTEVTNNIMFSLNTKSTQCPHSLDFAKFCVDFGDSRRFRLFDTLIKKSVWFEFLISSYDFLWYKKMTSKTFDIQNASFWYIKVILEYKKKYLKTTTETGASDQVNIETHNISNCCSKYLTFSLLFHPKCLTFFFFFLALIFWERLSDFPGNR